jgi:hypothetical protein
MPPAIAPTTANGIAIRNSTLGLKARPNESFSAAFQPGQARNNVGVENVITKVKKMPTIILILIAIYAVMIEMSFVITSVIKWKGSNDNVALHKSAHASSSSGRSQSRRNTASDASIV